FTNYWFLRFGTGIDAGLYDHRETRGNGLYRKPANYFARIQIITDSRSNVIVSLAQSFGGERSRGMISTQLGVELKPESWMEIELESEYGIVRHLEAWVENISLGGTTASVFGDRNTNEFNLTFRSTITFTRELTLQFYSQVFLAKGHYDKFRRLISPSEFDTVTYTGNPDFNRQSLNTNVVLRWEYSPGSTLYLVWSQARNGGNSEYFNSFRRDFSDTFNIPPANVLLLKVSYWWSL
ncbi:MAG TPA: DUF5916 domain-containing protein, partial [Bacteroidota bacterium]|nr:DUF5916 domain-containing protein [Bacteroidota bacterium]